MTSGLQAFDTYELATWTDQLHYFMTDIEAETASIQLNRRIDNYEASYYLHLLALFLISLHLLLIKKKLIYSESNLFPLVIFHSIQIILQRNQRMRFLQLIIAPQTNIEIALRVLISHLSEDQS